MTDYYVDPGASGANDGTSWTDAWEDIQTAFDTVTAGNICYCRGTQTLTVKIDVDTQTGDITNGYIKFIGCNAGGTVDGTRFVLDGNTAAAQCLYFAILSNYYWLENFEFKNATSHGYYAPSYGDNNIIINCIAHNNGGDGFYIGGSTTTCILCRSYSNTSDGFYLGAISVCLLFCVSNNNSAYGMNCSTGTSYGTIYGCIIHSNTTYGIENIDYAALILNNIIDGETTGLVINDHTARIIGNRITNNTTGIDLVTKLSIAGWNYFHDNTADVTNATLAYNIPYRAALTNHLMSAGIDGTNKEDVDADDGYNNRANDDFNLKASRTLIRTEIDLEIGT